MSSENAHPTHFTLKPQIMRRNSSTALTVFLLPKKLQNTPDHQAWDIHLYNFPSKLAKKLQRYVIKRIYSWKRALLTAYFICFR